jgi:hypothetical protein
MPSAYATAGQHATTTTHDYDNDTIMTTSLQNCCLGVLSCLLLLHAPACLAYGVLGHVLRLHSMPSCQLLNMQPPGGHAERAPTGLLLR